MRRFDGDVRDGYDDARQDAREFGQETRQDFDQFGRDARQDVDNFGREAVRDVENAPYNAARWAGDEVRRCILVNMWAVLTGVGCIFRLARPSVA